MKTTSSEKAALDLAEYGPTLEPDFTYLKFAELSQVKPRKTKVWNVYATVSGVVLGQIRWFGRWRKYCFYPNPNTIWDNRCLMTILVFLGQQTKLRQLKAIAPKKDEST